VVAALRESGRETACDDAFPAAALDFKIDLLRTGSLAGLVRDRTTEFDLLLDLTAPRLFVVVRDRD